RAELWSARGIPRWHRRMTSATPVALVMRHSGLFRRGYAVFVMRLCRLRLCVRLKEREILAVPLGRELAHRDEPHRRRVHAIALTRGWRPVVEQMTEVRVGMRRAHLGAFHHDRVVLLVRDVARLQ